MLYMFVLKSPNNELGYNYGLFSTVEGISAYATSMFGSKEWSNMVDNGWNFSKVQIEVPYIGHNGVIFHVIKNSDDKLILTHGLFKTDESLQVAIDQMFTKRDWRKRGLQKTAILVSEVQSEAPILISASVK